MTSLKLSVPSKVFLLGEYAVLAGDPAWVVSVSPRFSWESAESSRPTFHVESLAGRFSSARGVENTGRWIDPWEGRGGFGGSTAEFAVVAYRSGIRDAKEAWSVYRSLSEGESPFARPSGADLVVQWMGGAIEWNPVLKTATRLNSRLQDFPVLMFSATHLPNRKTVTHAHLDAISGVSIAWDSLRPALLRAQAGADRKDWNEVGHAFSAFADSLAHLGLESPVVRNERLALSRLPGVLGVKGCGSLQTDAMVVVVEKLASPCTDAIIAFAQEECGLHLLSRGVPDEPGIREEKK